MNTLLRDDRIRELKDGSNTSFLLGGEGQFSITDYKVLRGQVRSGLARCEKVLYNGQIKLLYLTEGKTPLEKMLPVIGERAFTGILADILGVFMNIGKNGFLETQRLLMDARYIFVDESTMKVKMIYLPVESGNGYISGTVGQVQTYVVDWVKKCIGLSERYVLWITELFSQECKTVKDIYEEVLNMCSSSGELVKKEETIVSREAALSKKLRLYSVNEPVLIQFMIDGKNFVIGRDSKQVDGVIVGHPTVGRKHCQILFKDGEYYIEDNASKNGTFLNGEKLILGFPEKISDQARIQIADIVFNSRYE